MSQASGIKVGSIVLSGAQVVLISWDSYIQEHQIPGLEGGVVERLGTHLPIVELHGFVESGADSFKDKIYGSIGSGQNLIIPSQISGNYMAVVSGAFFVEKALVEFPSAIKGGKGAKSFPYYEWMIRGPVSGGILAHKVANPTISLAEQYCSGNLLPLAYTETWDTINSSKWDWSDTSVMVDTVIFNSPPSSLSSSGAGSTQPTGLLKTSGYTNIQNGGVTTWLYVGSTDGAPYFLTFLNQAASGGTGANPLLNSYYVKTFRNGTQVPNNVLVFAKQVNGVETVIQSFTYPPPTTLPLNSWFQTRVSWCTAGLPSSGITMRLEVNTGSADSPTWTQWGTDVTDLNGAVGATYNRVGVTVTSPAGGANSGGAVALIDDTFIFSS